MRPEFSESAFGRALLSMLQQAVRPEFELIPLLPDRSDAPDDTGVRESGQPVFFHLGLAHCMLTPKATGWAEHDARFFRFELPYQLRQHHRLLHCLSRVEANVFYAAPAFYRVTEFSEAVARARLVEDSRFFPLDALPELPDPRSYYVTYRYAEPGFCVVAAGAPAVPKQWDLPVDGGAFLLLLREMGQQQRALGWRYLLTLREQLVACREQATEQRALLDAAAVDLGEVTPGAVLRDLNFLLWTQYGLEAWLLRRST